MSIYEKSTKELMKDFAATLKPGEVFSTKMVKDWFANKYSKIKPATVAMHVEGMSINCRFRGSHPTIRPGSGHDVFSRLDQGNSGYGTRSMIQLRTTQTRLAARF